MTAGGMELRHQVEPGDLGMIVHLHGVIYAREHGLDTSFEPYVARPLSDFVLAGPGAGRLWIAGEGRRMIGSIALATISGEEGQLRWFLLAPEARGMGHGRRMLETAIEYGRDAGLARIFLWTLADLGPAIRLYRRFGFQDTEQVRHRIWGGERTEVRMQLELL